MQDTFELDLNKVNALAFSGGGAKGVAEVGALQVIEQRIDLNKITQVSGTSAGAIIAVLLAVGYSVAEIYQEIFALDFTHFLDDMGKDTSERFLKAGDQFANQQFFKGSANAAVLGPKYTGRIIQNRGIFSGDHFLEWVFSKINVKLGKPANYCLTFAELDHLAKLYPGQYRSLHVVTFNLTRRREEIFSAKTYPNAVVADAVRASMSLPLIFKPHHMYHVVAGERVMHQDADEYRDGGEVRNYPISVFDGEQRKNHTLGLKLTNPNSEHNARTNMDRIKSHSGAMFAVQHARYHQHKEYKRTIEVDNLGLRTTQLRLDDATKVAMIESGQICAQGYFAGGLNLEQSARLDVLRQQVAMASSIPGKEFAKMDQDSLKGDGSCTIM